MEQMLLVVCGIVAGVCGGLFGIGGGIVIVPFLVFVLGFAQKRAQGTSLVALLAPVGLLGLLEYRKNGDADLAKGALIAAGFVLGAWGGSKIAVGLSDDVMQKSFAAFLVLVGLYLFFRR